MVLDGPVNSEVQPTILAWCCHDTADQVLELDGIRHW
jgi:hypothetical protein